MTDFEVVTKFCEKQDEYIDSLLQHAKRTHPELNEDECGDVVGNWMAWITEEKTEEEEKEEVDRLMNNIGFRFFYSIPESLEEQVGLIVSTDQITLSDDDRTYALNLVGMVDTFIAKYKEEIGEQDELTNS